MPQYHDFKDVVRGIVVPSGEDIQRIYKAACIVARGQRSDCVGTSELLLGIMIATPNAAANLLAQCGISLEDVCSAVQLIPGAGRNTRTMCMTPYALNVIDDGFRDAVASGKPELDSVSLLAALVRNPGSGASDALIELLTKVQRI